MKTVKFCHHKRDRRAQLVEWLENVIFGQRITVNTEQSNSVFEQTNRKKIKSLSLDKSLS